MKTRLVLILAALCLTTGWTIRDLGTLPGGGLSVARTINNGGMVAGMAGNSAGVMRAVWWDAATGTIHEIPTPVVPGRFSSAYGINEKGAIVGRMGTTTSDAHAFKYQFGVVTDLTASSTSIANAISLSNNIAGQWTVAGTPTRHYAVVWGGGTAGTPTALGGFGGWIDFASDIANSPVVAGTAALPSPTRRHAFLWVSGSMRDLGTLGGTNSFGRSLTVGTWPDPTEASIFVTGESEIIPGSFDTRAFIYNAGIMQNIGTLPGCTQTTAYAINKWKQVVGSCWGAGYSRAWLWTGSTMVALESLIDPAEGWEQLQVAHDINDAGKIVGHGIHHGQFRAFVMTP